MEHYVVAEAFETVYGSSDRDLAVSLVEIVAAQMLVDSGAAQ